MKKFQIAKFKYIKIYSTNIAIKIPLLKAYYNLQPPFLMSLSHPANTSYLHHLNSLILHFRLGSLLSFCLLSMIMHTNLFKNFHLMRCSENQLLIISQILTNSKLSYH